MAIKVLFLDDERKTLYGPIFPDGLPVISPVQVVAALDGLGRQSCYLLDPDQIAPEQRDQLCATLAGKFAATADDVAKYLALGLPIRADQTTLVLDGPHLGLLMPDAVGHFDDLHPLDEMFGSDDDDLFDDDDDPDDEAPPPDNANEITF
jgi:hypothetical protein